MVQLVLGHGASCPRPDDAADALAVAIWAANTERRRAATGAAAAGHGPRGRRARSTAAESRYDRAVREALARERRRERDRVADRVYRTCVIASRRGHGRRRSRSTRS